MESTTEGKTVKQPKIIVVAGIERSGSSFIHKALCEAIRLAGFTVQSAINLSCGELKQKWNLDGEEVDSLSESNLKETDFIVLRVLDYSIELEAKANLIFTSTRTGQDIIFSMRKFNDDPYIYSDIDCLEGFENLVKWMRSGKHAYCMDFNSPMNAKGLHNYANLRNILLPMNFAFRPLDFFKDRTGKNLNPKDLIEAIIPELKGKSDDAQARSASIISGKVEELKNKEKEERNGEES